MSVDSSKVTAFVNALTSKFSLSNHTHAGMLVTGDIIDNLTTDNANKPLSARQGKVLYDMIVGIEEDMNL